MESTAANAIMMNVISNTSKRRSRGAIVLLPLLAVAYACRCLLLLAVACYCLPLLFLIIMPNPLSIFITKKSVLLFLFFVFLLSDFLFC
jgi:hypothetical protein